ncbi:ketoacyl-ACP synthase III family protein [Streptomyces sp. NPDC060184]|uniref:ketoacyl-ACP synthase III family protein n=1 Tax=Streptomyces sp. NPDC060184 TaxID=3347064 RepID=UPI00366303BA
MRWNDIHVAGTGAWLPDDHVTAEQAVADGDYSADEAGRSEQLTLTVAPPEASTPGMAAAAARQALWRAGADPGQVDVLLYSVLKHNGINVANPTSYVQREVGSAAAFAAEVRAGSNGGLAALELACDRLSARPEANLAVVACADIWGPPHFDRWRADSGLVFGDGGSAVAVSTRGGFARLRSLVTTQDPELEGLHRGHDSFGDFRNDADHPIDLYRRAQEFLTRMPKEELWKRGSAGLHAAVSQATQEAGVDLASADHIVLPHFGSHLLQRQVLRPLGLTGFTRTTWEFARRVGHLGAGDQLAGLNHLAESGSLRAGEHIVLVGVGGGFNWSCAVLEVGETPGWTRRENHPHPTTVPIAEETGTCP